MFVVEDADGRFAVEQDGRRLASGFETNAAAWKWIDRRDRKACDDEERRVRIGVAFQSR